MKNLFITIFCLCTALFSSAEQGNFEAIRKCRPHLENVNPELPASQMIRLDLTQGDWSEEDRKWSFQEDGTAQVVRKTKKGSYTFEAYQWDVKIHEAEPILYLTTLKNAHTQHYFVSQTCDGVSLSNVRNESSIQLNFEDEARLKADAAKRSITGHWENVLNKTQLSLLFPNQEEGLLMIRAKLSFDFNNDGTFSQILDGEKDGILKQSKGKWAVSKDGKFLLLSQLSNGEADRCIPIQYLQLDELVLRQVLPQAGVTESDRGLYFNKL